MVKFIDILGNIERVLGICFAVCGSLAALKAWPTSGDCTGVGAALSITGLMGSLLFGMLLFISGRGLINRNQLARRLQISVAVLAVWSALFSMFTPGDGLPEAIALSVGVAFVILMLLPSVRSQFAKSNPEEE